MMIQYPIINKGSDGKIVKNLGEILPDIGTSIFSLTFIIKAVNLSDCSTFMIPSKNSDPILISDLVSQQKTESFHALIASIHVISKE